MFPRRLRPMWTSEVQAKPLYSNISTIKLYDQTISLNIHDQVFVVDYPSSPELSDYQFFARRFKGNPGVYPEWKLPGMLTRRDSSYRRNASSIMPRCQRHVRITSLKELRLGVWLDNKQYNIMSLVFYSWIK